MRKKLFTLFLAMMACLGTLFAESGTCGPNLTWDLTDGVLTISGIGEMKDYSNYINDWAPWDKSRSLIESVIINDGCTSIGSYAFYGCRGLTSITIPNSVTSIGNYAFYYCTGLTSVTIPNSVISIGSYAFSYCTGLTSVTIPNSVISIGERAFEYCSSLTSVTIPNSVTSIGISAFSGCSALTSLTIPNSVTSIGEWAFNDCSGLTSVTIPNSVTWIGNGAFSGCRGLTSITIPNSVTSIGSSAFSRCSGLTSITIPNSVTSIGNRAFSGCSGLTSITIPNSVTSIGDAFCNCGSLNSMIVESGNLVYDSRNNCNAIIETATNTLVCGCKNTDIPNSVTRIGQSAFEGCTGLTSVTIPNSVTSIGQSAFEGCSGLTSVTIGNSVTSIGSVAFSGCSNLTSLTIPNSVTWIGMEAFSACYSLTSVHISDIAAWCAISFGRDDANPLFYAHNLYLNGSLVTDLVIPNSVTSIGNYAFYGCRGLTSVTIPNSVISIGERAFEYCRGLTSITIPNSVTNIGNDAFRGCSGLTSVFSLPSTPPTISSSTFPADVIVYVPNASLNNYKSASNWKDLNIKGLCNAEILNAPTSASLDFSHILWTLENNYISSCGIEGGEQQPGNVLEYIGLEPNSEYNNVPIVLTANTGETEIVNVSFTTPALELTTKPSKPVSSTTAILLAETNMSDAEISCGFEYKRNDAPADMDGTKVYCPVASGQMAGRLKNLKDDVYYKYRAFYQSAAGNMYYGDWQYIFTGDVAVEFDPILYTYGATVVRENEATISGYALAGSEDFTEQGFEYWAESRTNGGANAPHRMPAALNEHFFVQASGIALRATLTNLDAGTIYKYRVYGKVGDQYYYGAEQSFATQGEYEGDDSEAIEEVPSDQVPSTKAQKILHNGQIYILRGEKIYTLTGQEVK